MNKGAYIVFEGPGYSGKSTVMRLVAEELRKQGLVVMTTREPGGCFEAEEIRQRIFDLKADGRLSPAEELAMFYEARVVNLREVVLPAVGRGKFVLKDRDHLSTFLYQVVSGLSREEVLARHRNDYQGLGYPEPDLRLMFTISEETLMRRIDRGAEGDPFDGRALEMVKAYGAEAVDIARGRGFFAGNTEVVDANWSVETVKNTCLRLIERRFLIEEDVEGKRRRVEY